MHIENSPIPTTIPAPDPVPTTRARRCTAVAMALAIASTIALGACSDGDRLTEAEFVTRGNAVCDEISDTMNEELAAAFGDEEPTPAELDAVFVRVIELLRQSTTDLDALDEPSELTDDLAAYTEAVDEITDEVEDAGVEALMASEDPWASTNAAAIDLGLDACAGS